MTIPYYVPYDGDALNYDGETTTLLRTLSGQSMTAMAYRRMKAWQELDFTHELSGANDLSNIARKIGEYQAKEKSESSSLYPQRIGRSW